MWRHRLLGCSCRRSRSGLAAFALIGVLVSALADETPKPLRNALARTTDYEKSLSPVYVQPCTPEENRSSVEFAFPKDGAKLDSMLDLSLGRNLLIRFKVSQFKLQVDGWIALMIALYTDEDMRAESGEEYHYKTVMPVGESNIELFGIIDGKYEMHAVLMDNDQVGRMCWKADHIVFTVEKQKPENRSVALLKGIEKLRQEGGRSGPVREGKSWLPMPQSHEDFGYVIALWGDGYIDNVLAWAAGMDAVGSTFQRYCMVILDMMAEETIAQLERCCCKILPVDVIRAPSEATKGQWNRYELVLTKLRMFQLGRFGLRKVVLMDADVLVLQNMDELFWMPAPACVILPGSVLGQTPTPHISAGLIVIEPSEEEFEAIMQKLSTWVENVKDKDNAKDVLLFIEQDLLDMHWESASAQPKWTALPIVYNLDPRMLDTLPFLVPEDPDKGATLPLDHGVKMVHLWHWYNPMLATSGSARQSMQLNARMKHKTLWKWYELWWRLHQQGMAKAIPGKYPTWLHECRTQNIGRFGKEHGDHFRPVLKHASCVHMYGGLAW